MITRLCKMLLVGLMILTGGCGSNHNRNWGQFQGDPASQGYQNLKSGYALSSAWVTDAYPISSASPVIGTGFDGAEVIYVGTVDGRLLALNARDGSLKWQRRLASGDEQFRILSSPAVAESGAIYTLANRRIGYGRLQTRLFKVDSLGFVRWSFEFPSDVFATGSPKTINFQGSALIFIHVTIISAQTAYGALYVIEDQGEHAAELSHRPLGDCRRPLPADPAAEGGLPAQIEGFWQRVTAGTGFDFAPDSAGSGAFLLPTPAVLSNDQYALIATVDNICGFGVYRWDGETLRVQWQKGHNGLGHSSPSILPGYLMVFGGQNGDVLGFDLLTGAQRWAHNVGAPVLATPAGAAEKFVFVVSRRDLIRLDTDTGLPLYNNGVPMKIALSGPTYASPALTSNRVYVCSSEMLTASFDLKTRGHDTSFRGNGMSSVAVGNDGSVYAVAADGKIHKYQGTR